jgi:hypothetical protein
MTVTAPAVMMFVPVVVGFVVVVKTVEIVVTVLVIVGRLRYDEQNSVSDVKAAKTWITTGTTRHSTSPTMSMGVA